MVRETFNFTSLLKEYVDFLITLIMNGIGKEKINEK